MNISDPLRVGKDSSHSRFRSRYGLAAVLIALVGFLGSTISGHAQQADGDAPGTQVLTRGPVHEAFAGVVSYDPEPGIVVTKTPPEAIEEIPPEERPEGDNVAWIPGYWAWDDERSDFLWISGTWRALPPDREWMAGYWNQTSQGYQWISGYWADATVNETTYLPMPPATMEEGPNVEAPSLDYGWTPGCWLWNHGRYAWRPGYWTEGRADWDWTPAHYVWTPRGYIFVDGFWDYSVERRGILFAPVYFEAGVYSRRGYHYSPTIAISLGVFTDHLFLRPSYSHYYFGDYYASSYERGGFFASFSFQSSRHGYDPFYSHQRWENRNDREWDHRVAASYQYRRDHETARPPRTWSAQIKIDSRTREFTQNRVEVAVSIDQLAKRKDTPMRFQPVASKERQQLVQRGQEVQKSRDQRRSVEAREETPSVRTPGVAVAPVKVPQPRSPIVAKPASKLGKNQAPPKLPSPPKSDSNVGSKTEPSPRPSGTDRTKAETRSRSPESERKSTTAPNDPVSGSRAVPPTRIEGSTNAAEKAAEESRQKAREPAQKQPRESEAKAESAQRAEEAQRSSRAQDQKKQQELEQREKASALKVKEETRQKEKEQKTQQQLEQRTKAEAAKQAKESQKKAQENDQKKRDEAEQREKVSAIRAQEESQRNAREMAQPTRREAVKPDQKKVVKDKVSGPTRKDERAEEKKAPAPEEDPHR